jgi:hypothetical protein
MHGIAMREAVMGRSLKSLERHVIGYHLFYLLAYVLVMPVWLKLTSLLLYKNMTVAPLLLLFNVGMFLIFVAIIKHYRSNLRTLARISLVVGLLIEVIALVQLLVPTLSHPAVALPMLISLVMSIWWTVVYFLDLSSINREQSKLLGKQVLRYFILCAVLLYGSSAVLGVYYRRQIDAILAAGSVNVAGGLDSTQIESMMDARIWQAALLDFVQLIVIVVVFLYFYKRARTIVEK